jgi:hypothetical protein
MHREKLARRRNRFTTRCQPVGASVYSLGEPSNTGGPDLGQPITFFFGYDP